MKKFIFASLMILNLNPLKALAGATWAAEAVGTGDQNASCGGAALAILTCAPEVQISNIAATDDALKALTARELSGASKFKKAVMNAQKLNEQKRMAAYFAFVGVQSDTEIASFLGERTVNPKYVENLSNNLDLTPDQSRLVIDQITQAMLGERK